MVEVSKLDKSKRVERPKMDLVLQFLDIYEKFIYSDLLIDKYLHVLKGFDS
jgi:hypothetical protein